MAITVTGALPSAQVVAGDKFRVTWQLLASKIGLTPDAVGVALKIQQALPTMGFYTVSNPSAVAGDAVVVFDVRTTANFAGHTVADAVAQLDNLPALLGGWAADVLAVKVLALKGSSVTPGPAPSPESSAQIAAGIDQAKTAGNTTAAATSLWAKITGALGTIGTVAAVGAVVVLVVLVAGFTRGRD